MDPDFAADQDATRLFHFLPAAEEIAQDFEAAFSKGTSYRPVKVIVLSSYACSFQHYMCLPRVLISCQLGTGWTHAMPH